MAAHPADIVSFWRSAGVEKWFAKSAAFDEAIRLKYEATHHAAARGEYDPWIETAEGALALLILLDQFPRNLFRGSAHQFATDPKARRITREAIARGHDLATEIGMRQFFYLPFEHAENLADQDFGLGLTEALDAAIGAGAEFTKWSRIHRDIIARFGRFPHRNHAFGRETTQEEQAFLDEGGFAG